MKITNKTEPKNASEFSSLNVGDVFKDAEFHSLWLKDTADSALSLNDWRSTNYCYPWKVVKLDAELVIHGEAA